MPTTPSHQYRNQRHKHPKKTSTTKLPQELQRQVEAQAEDERKFEVRFKNRAQSRKDMRKQLRIDKKRRHMLVPKNLCSDHQYSSPNKRQKTGPAAPVSSATPSPSKTTSSLSSKPSPKKTTTSTQDSDVSARALEKLSVSNPKFFSLLQASNLVSSNATAASLSSKAFEDDDRDIENWEKKLGMKKKSKRFGKTWEEEGLADLLEGLDDSGEPVNNKNNGKVDKIKAMAKVDDKAKDVEVGDKRRRKLDAMEVGSNDDDELDSDIDGEEEEGINDLIDDLEYGQDEEDNESEDDENEGDNEDDENEDDDEPTNRIEEDEDVLFDSESEDDGDDQSDKEEKAEGKDNMKLLLFQLSFIHVFLLIYDHYYSHLDVLKPSTTDTLTSTTNRYVPPQLRSAPTTKSEQQIRLQKQLQGLLNKLSESNMESILMEIDKCYQLYPRHDVTSTITTMILTTVSQKTNLLDSFVILYAVVVASLYRLVGVEFAAHFVQTMIESFEQHFRSLTFSSSLSIGDDDPPGSKEAKNLITLVAELYNFQVVSCVLVYDLVRMLIEKLDEPSVELLLRVIRASGTELRQDDPTALKDIIQSIQTETAKRDRKLLSSRHKFMLETIANLKNNKVKSTAAATSQGDKETLLKMTKFLGNLGKKRSTHSTEALRVSLNDIRNVETKGKWWLVGSSWRDNMVGTESKHSTSSSEGIKNTSATEALVKLARQQGMNTDVRRSIFVVLMSSEDYIDAFERLLKLNLTEVQEREIARVILHCAGNEKTHNPYYALIANRLCGHNHSFKITFQYCLWDFLREMGEADVGGLEKVKSLESLHASDAPSVPLRRSVNLAKFYAWLVSEHALSLVILKTVHFTTLRPSSRFFFQLFFANVITNSQTRAQVTGRRDAKALVDIVLKVAPLPTLAQGVLFFLHHFVKKAEFLGEGAEKDKEKELIIWGYDVIKESVQSAINNTVGL
ncbi:hypothetical protein BC937DRAFT_88599 [Endogone sp. FLAS-F59071]|nr:hypothetical protein BC937DRAFT_88599 [Endogone sp. FLAS-F59071]|eukprot:RUS18583.1 hypothetical protein BC937DRAFT_88599 [Endogone sp. FLAS-F59071]